MPNFDDLHRTLTSAQRYAIALALFTLALVLRLTTLPIHGSLAFVTFYPAILISYYICGRNPGILVTLLTALAVDYYFLPPFDHFELTPDHIPVLGYFFITAFLIGAFISRLHRQNTALATSNELLSDQQIHLQTLIETLPDLVWLKNAEGVYLSCNTRFENFFGAKVSEIIGKTDYDFVDKELADFFREHDKMAMEKNGPSVNEEWVTFSNDGHQELLETTKAPVYDHHGKLIGVLGIAHNITDRKKAEDLLTEQKEYLETIVENEPECVKVVSLDGQLQTMNRAGLEMLEVDSLEEAQKTGLSEFVNLEHRKAFFELHKKVCSGESGVLEFPIKGKRGTERWLETHAAPLHDAQGNVTAFLGITRDITEHKVYQSTLESQARVDYLTGVNNRRHFMELAEVELARAIRYENTLSLLMMDIDFFKKVNDSHGHKTGDAVLRKLAEVSRLALREVDIIGRLGGEEFAILLPETDHREAYEVADRLRQELGKARIALGSGLPLSFTVSIGVTSLLSKEDNIDMLLNRADVALYEAKNSGRNKVCAVAQD